jgi:hypothetical protein
MNRPEEADGGHEAEVANLRLGVDGGGAADLPDAPRSGRDGDGPF